MSDKIVNTFQARRQLNEEMAGLSETQTEAELLARVRGIGQRYEPLLVLSTLTKFLDNASSQMRGGLGRLATLLPYDETVSVLRKEAANRQNSTQVRLTAAMILERFLRAELAPGLMSDLQDPEIVVMQSLQDALAESHETPYILLEYVHQMRQENEQIAFLVLELLGRLDPADQPDLLRLVAYDTRPAVAQAALEQLGMLRQGAASQRAAQVLYTLQPNLAPDLAQLAERSLRKLRFSGVRFDPPPIHNWRALMTTSTPDGSQDIWFLHRGSGESEKSGQNEEDNLLIGLRINANVGLLDTFGSEAVDSQYLPSARSVGELVSIARTNESPTVFLEVPFGYAHWRLRQALKTHWSRPNPSPLPDEYTFYNPYLFDGTVAHVPDELQALLASGPALWQKSSVDLEESAAILLRHPAMASWFFQNMQMVSALYLLQRGDETAFAQTISDLKQKLFNPQVEQSLGTEIQAGLLAQAGWLAIAGHPQHARYAVLLAESFNHVRVAEHPLTNMMVEVGLLLLDNRRQRAEERP